MMILRLFGIPAASFGCSVDGVEGMSHRTTVVCDVTKNSMSFYLMDAYLNYHFADTNSGEILEFCEMVKRIRLKQYDSIRLMETKVSRPYLAEPGDSTCHQWIFPNDRNMPLIEKRNNVWIYGPASPSLMTWVPACWPDRLEELLDGRSLEQFMLDMMLCNTNYGGFGNKNIDKIFADKIASANRFSIDNSVRTGQGSVMKLKKYDIKQPNTKPPQPQGWEQLWNGYYQMTKVCSEEKRRRNELSHSKVDLSSGVLGEGQFERQLFVNIIANINKEHINMFELGAGRGDWCMSLAGVVDHHLIPHRTKTYRCLALEGEPTHFQWTRDHFEHQNINGVAVHGAIQSYNGFCKFDANPEPADNYGQSVKDRGNIEIPCYTIDWLMKDYSFDHLDIIHIDVQGAEYDALLGASEAINKKAIDYLLIGTHTDDMNEKIMELIGNKYNCIIDIVHRTHLIDTPIGKASMPVDGIMLMQRKGIETPLPEEIDGAQSNRLDAQSNSGGIVELEKDALVMVIDIHDEMPGDNAKALDGWQGYYEKNMANLCSLLEHCNDNNIKVQEALYYGTRSRRLKHIRFDYTLDDKLDYSQFSDVYFCGISLDQCVVNRPLGYFKLSHHSKTLLENCSFQGLKYTGPIDYCITKQPFKEVGRFENIKQLYGRIEEFLMINKINAANWAKKKNIKHSSVDLISGYDNHGSETEEKQQMFQSWIDRMGRAKKRIFYRDQTVQSLSFLADLVRKHKPTKIIELGTAAGMSLRTWISATSDTGIVAVDLDFSRLHDNKDIIPLDLSRVKLIEGNILQTDFTPLWDANDRVLFFVDAHDLDDAPIMNYILQNVASLLPEGSLIVVDDLWYSSETITESNVQKVFRWITSDQVDPLQAFEGHYAPYWKGGAFVGFKEVVPLMEWVNRNRIQLQFEHKGKTVAFECNKNITNYSTDNFNIDEFNKMTGKSFYNPLDKVMVVGNNDPADQRAKVLCQQAKALFVKRRIKESLQCLMSAMSLTKNITVGAYAIAICHARLENFDIALKALEFEMNSAIPHPWARKLFMGINEYLNGHQKEAKQSLPLDIKKHHEVNEKYLSVVVTSRNDDHGGNTLHRTQVFLSGLAEQCRRFDLNAELIIVEWNPPADRKRLYEVLDWPEDLGPLSVRFIEVPEEVHNSIGNSDKFPLFQMIAKNVGIRRAEGKFVLATNIDVLLNDELMQFISDKQLDENCFYRIDRYDTFNKEIPMNIDVTAQLEFCKNSLVRIQGLHGTKNISEMEGDHFAYGPGDKRIHSNACGDFTLMAKQKWIAFRAYPELPLWSIYVDSLFLHMPYVSGLRQVILPEPMRVYHIEHETGWEVISETMKERPSLNYHQQYLPWCQQMIAQSTPLTNNDDNWGYAKVNFKEHVIAGKQQGLTIFTIPKAFKDHTNVIQRNAIKSWMNLNLRPEIILFGNDKGTKEIAEEFGLTHIPDVNCNEFGTPQIDCLFNMAQQSASNDIIAYVNADIILFNDFIDAANNVENKSEKFLMVGQHWDVGITEHVNFDDNQWSRRLLDRVKLEGQQHSPTGIDYFVFKKGLWPTIPPFAIGRTTWDNWLVAEALRQGGTVVDATDDVTVIHQEHDYAHLSGGKDEVWNGPEAKKNLAMAGGHGSMKWISHLNTALVGGEFVSNVVRQNRKGNACFEKGDMKGSIDAFDRITKIEPGNIIAHNNLGIAYQQDSEMSHALKSFAKAYQLDPHNRLTVFNIYRLYMQMGSQSDADRLLSKYLGARPADTAILQEIATLKETVTGNKKDRRKITSTSPAVSPPVVNVK
ncbi:MAG: FkbM family methyltransferase [Planctomycetes bacterium]|nr:FkbM family methyltransferase [Planctomycetota bacterium]